MIHISNRKRNRRHGVHGRRLHARGRFALVGLAVLVLTISFGLFSALDVSGGFWSEARTEKRSVLPSVAATRASQSPRRPAPPSLLRRLPVGEGNGVYAFDVAEDLLDAQGVSFASAASDPAAGARLVEFVRVPLGSEDLSGPLRIEYSIDSELTRRIFRILRTGRVERGHVIVLDPQTGRVLAYASTAPEEFPPTRSYPAASLIKVVTASAVLELAPDEARRPCRFRGSPYRLTAARVRRPRSGREISLGGALATSNNQCFAQFAVGSLGGPAMLSAIARFGWLDAAAPGHDAGSATVGESDYDLGRLGCGLAGCRITPLHAARLAATLATGEDLEPWWIDRILDAEGRVLELPPHAEPRRVMRKEMADELRGMLVRTTTRGTARSAFRDRRGRPKLGSIRVAGKTGNISGTDPKGRYEWFIGAAPAERPTVAIAVVQVHGHLWWMKSSEIASEVLSEIFCARRRCSPELARRYTGGLGDTIAPVFLSESGR